MSQTPQDDNPWILAPLLPEAAEPERALPPQSVAAPQPGVNLPHPTRLLPVRAQPETAPLWWVGAHGGAGESTLAALHPGHRETGHSWPLHIDGTPVNVMLVARTNHAGLKAAAAAAQHWASGTLPHVTLLGLVLVADIPGKLPRPLREQQTIVAGGVPRTWSVPWIEQWRLGEPLPAGKVPPALRSLAADLDTILA
ncbi:DUF6668 family protein [Streptomyces bacillaris]|uniref:DUF6668 family protein n=1 Tax=Streptomyces bacillaris TaxID=68179 RepID=UPI0036DB64E1